MIGNGADGRPEQQRLTICSSLRQKRARTRATFRQPARQLTAFGMPLCGGTDGGNQAIPLGTPFAQTAGWIKTNCELKTTPFFGSNCLEEGLKSRIGGDRDISAEHRTPGLSGMSDPSPVRMCTGGPLITKKPGSKI